MNLVQVIKRFLSDVDLFSRAVVQKPLRSYQLAPAKAIIDSVLSKRGDTFAVVMSRQAGKNELSAQLEAYLMNLFQQVRGASLVKASPTYRPQTLNSKMRLRDCLDNPWNAGSVHGDEGYIVRLGRCRAFFFSAHATANVVGATASILLECDEAQDVDADKWSKDFAPMASSTNATTVFYGTIWTSRTLLARVMRRLREQTAVDGIQRVFLVPWQQVAAEVPAYGEYVKKEMARLGESHPIIRTQYKLEEIDEAGRLFTTERVARMRGSHAREHLTPYPLSPRQRTRGERGMAPKPSSPSPEALSSVSGDRYCAPRCWRGGLGDEVFVLTVDVAGEDEEGVEGEELRVASPRKDSTVATVFRVDLSTVEDPLIGFPTYDVVNRYWWTGIKHSQLYATLLDLVRQWRAYYLVVDATGVGAGLASFLAKKLGGVKDHPPGLVVPFEFSQDSKSDLGWRFLALVETGRYKEYADDQQADTAQFWREVEACEFEVLPGPGKVLRWGVPDPAVHDDMLISAALVSVLDGMEWSIEIDSEVIPAGDPLAGKKGRGYRVGAFN